MQRTYRTPHGTELPLLNLRGGEYLEVKYRLVWFREDHPDWAIETKLMSVDQDSAYARATVKDEKGRVIATSHKFESRSGFADFMEKAETGAIGRALALIGYGTQFCADEFDEGERIVDSPVNNLPGFTQSEPRMGAPLAEPGASASAGASAAAQSGAAHSRNLAEYEITFGRRYRGMRLREISPQDLEGYIEWLDDNAAKKGLPLSDEARILKQNVMRYLSAGAGAGAAAGAGEAIGAGAPGAGVSGSGLS
jgi:hypothetical protein